MSRFRPSPVSGPTDPGVRRLPGLVWRVYLGFLVVLVSHGLLVGGIERFQPLDGVDLLIFLTSMAGLVGFVFSRALLRPGFWRVWVFIAVAWDATHLTLLPALKIAGLRPGATSTTSLDVLVGLMLAAPLYFGLFCYGYRSEDVWANSRDD